MTSSADGDVGQVLGEADAAHDGVARFGAELAALDATIEALLDGSARCVDVACGELDAYHFDSGSRSTLHDPEAHLPTPDHCNLLDGHALLPSVRRLYTFTAFGM